MSIKIGSTDFTEFDDLYNDPNVTPPAERAKIDFEVALIGKLIAARKLTPYSKSYSRWETRLP